MLLLQSDQMKLQVAVLRTNAMVDLALILGSFDRAQTEEEHAKAIDSANVKIEKLKSDNLKLAQEVKKPAPVSNEANPSQTN
jgi:hypothetical protein